MSKDTSSRRSFFLRAGAAATVPVALVAGTSANAGADSDLAARVAALEDVNALRRVCADFVRAVNAGDDVAGFERENVAEIVAEDFDDHAELVISDDRGAASLRVACRVGVDKPIDAPGSVLIDMARLNAADHLRETQSQILEMSCTRARSGWTVTRVQLVDCV